MNTNVVICRNEVIIEGVNVGQFESFECRADSRTLGQTGVLTLPLYAIGAGAQSGSARSRIRTTFVQGQDKEIRSLIRPCAEVKVYCWYTSTFWSKEGERTVLRSEDAEKTLVFSGFIEHVAEGFPTKIYLQDNSFILRFGLVEKNWEDKTLQHILADVVPLAQKTFNEERNRLGFSRSIPTLRYSNDGKNVQAETSPTNFNSLGGSPFSIVQSLMNQLWLYGGVSLDYNLYVGAWVKDNTRPVIKLDTRYNVINRDLVSTDGRFIDFYVQVNIVKKDGKIFTGKAGAETGEVVRSFSPLKTQEDAQRAAEIQLAGLRGFRNKGKITLLLYPKLDLMDWVEYTDTVFEELSSGYYVLDYEFKADERGYFQTIGVTDQVFAL